MQAEWFEAWFDSHYYHLLYQHRGMEEAEHFADRIVELFGAKPGERLLDLACGKGRHALAFARHGLDVSGVDLSMESIAYARQFEHDQLHFYVHDMRRIFRVHYFNYVCNLFTSFGYFAQAADNQLAAQSIAGGLKKDGKFLIDFVNRIPALGNIDARRNEVIEREGIVFTIERSYTENQFLKKITIDDAPRQLQYTERVNSFTLNQLKTLFEQAGLTLSSCYGNYALDAYDETNSPRMIMIFQK